MKTILGFGDRVRKIRGMRAAEIAERLRYGGFVALERARHARGRLCAPDRLERGLDAALSGPVWRARLLASRRRRTTPFYEGARDRDATRRLFDGPYRRERQAAIEQAALAREHRFAFFGQQFPFGREIPWQSDPVTGRAWPPVYHRDVPVHAGDVGFGDVKHVWELSRQQYLIDLGKAYFLEGDDRNVHAIRELVSGWIAANPYATGVNWACALEPAFRAFSWLWAYHLTVEALDDEFHAEWLTGFYDHARFLSAHLEQYSSPYNHLIGEAAALYVIAACFPEFRLAPRWRRQARTILHRRLGEQFYEDGGSVEQSTFYHHATIGFYLLAALMGRAAGDEFAPAIWRAIERGLEFSAALQQPDGTIPSIGGADDGKPIRMEHLPFWDFRPYLAVGAVLFGRADFAAAAGRFHEDALWLLGDAGRRAFDGLERADARPAVRVLPSSGYVVMRASSITAGGSVLQELTGRDQSHDDYVCFDCGEQAAGIRTDAIPNAMHGHADALSIVAWLDGRPVLVDSGFYAYNCGGAWEAHFRETAAHNTVRVDGRDQAKHLGKMAWSHGYRATLEDSGTGPFGSWAVGSHDGYTRGLTPVVHRRTVLLHADGSLIVSDELIGEGEHEFDVNFQFAPGTLERRGECSVVFDGGVALTWAGGRDWMAAVQCGGDAPDQGWIAASLGVRTPAPRLRLHARTQAPTVLLTAVASARAARPHVAFVPVDASRRVLAISGDDHVDLIAAAGLAGSPVDTDARLAVCRVREGRVIDTLRIGGTFVHVPAEVVAACTPLCAVPEGR